MAEPLRHTEAFKRIPVGRLGMPEEVAQAVLMVVANAFLTGQTLGVNGGILLD
jgi:3-oxoacyl-[acyl-carrier protein] reductase